MITTPTPPLTTTTPPRRPGPVGILPTGPAHVANVRKLNGAAVCMLNGGQHSRAIRTTKAASTSSIGGRPVRFGHVQLLRTRRRCQRRILSGVTRRWPRSARGSRRTRAAKIARSAQSRRGLGWVRRRTATSCRSTRSSTSLVEDERPAAGPARAPAGRSNRATTATLRDHVRSTITAGQRPRPDFWHPTGGAVRLRCGPPLSRRLIPLIPPVRHERQHRDQYQDRRNEDRYRPVLEDPGEDWVALLEHQLTPAAGSIRTCA
jgi:hypothetical protein